MKYISPSVRDNAFNCPHCGALAKQFWHRSFAEKLDDDALPWLVTENYVDELIADKVNKFDTEVIKLFQTLARGLPFLGHHGTARNELPLENIWLSSCYNCNSIVVWLYDRILWPQFGEAPSPNEDLPDDIRSDYNEASAILSPSPRGAAALLRLAIQKLCKHFGCGGKDLNADIAELVSKGLDVRVQKALDIVRVTGNEAVHPGTMDLRDDHATAEDLFRLVNFIADVMITQPKHLDEIYRRLPEEKLVGIEHRGDQGGERKSE